MPYILEDDPKFQRWVSYLIDNLKDMYTDLMPEFCCDADDVYTFLHPGRRPECPAYRAHIAVVVEDWLGKSGGDIVGVGYLSKEAVSAIVNRVHEGWPLNQILGSDTMDKIYGEIVPHIFQLVKREVTNIYRNIAAAAREIGISVHNRSALIKHFKLSDEVYGEYDNDVYALYLQDKIVDSVHENILS